MNITPVMEATVMLLLAILTYVLVPMIRAKLNADQLATIRMWVQIAVNAAEQIYTGSGKGREKKEYVVAFLESKGFKLDMDSLDKMIESSVLELKNATEIE